MNIKQIIELSNYNVSREDTKISKLGEIENKLIDVFFAQPKTNKQIEDFASSLYSNPNVFEGTGIDYSSISTVNAYFNSKKLSIQNVVENNVKTM